MVRVTDEIQLVQDQVTLYYATDPHLANLPVLIFHGPSTTTNSTLNSSRAQLHVFTAAGFQSYPRITISPNSPFYQSVNHLPRDRQGDEVCRALAFGLLKYLRELPECVKSGLILQSTNSRKPRPGSAPSLFGEQHAADLACSMVKVDNIGEVIRDIESALRAQHINHVDIDLVLPPGSISPFREDVEEPSSEEDFPDPILQQYGAYGSLVKTFGEVSFLPSSKLRRAPSKPTSLNRSRSFMKDQKLSLRREMGELVDTEERYVIKMHELVNHIAGDFRTKAKDRPYGSFSPSEEDLKKLFPRCLDRILQVNAAFLADIKSVMDETEEQAMQDLEAPANGSSTSRYGGTGRLKDPTGALAFAKVLLQWFPEFQDCYQGYIRASQDFPQIITSFLKQQSSFSQRVQQTGEQRLRSAVIEPVQRLPRYSLFIDNIANFLPLNHPALASMLKARDIITAICSMDPPSTEKSQTVNRLRNLVEMWPQNLKPLGRLITAVDFVEPLPPFHVPLSSSSTVREGIMLLFPDSIIILKKVRDGALSARGLVAEVDKPSAARMLANMTVDAGGYECQYELAFSGWHNLADTRFTATDDGHGVFMLSIGDLKDPGTGRDRTGQSATVRKFVLRGAYDAKAPKFTEEIVRARIEGRFAEAEREADSWSLRSTTVTDSSVQFHTAIFEEGIDTLKDGRKEPAPIRIVVDRERGTKGAPVGHYGVEIVANIVMMAGGSKYKLEVDGLYDRVFVDEVTLEHLLPTLGKRVTDLLIAHHRSSNPVLTAALVSLYSKTLRSLQIVSEHDKTKSFRPTSPVKILSNLLSGGFGTSTSSMHGSLSGRTTPKLPKTPQLSDIPNFEPTISRHNSNRSMLSIQEPDMQQSAWREDERPTNPLVRLEETFTGYIAALQSRKGNVVGKIIRNRGTADELSINAVYNTFIENPFDQRTASEVTVDVLFVAFEKFLRMAWKDQMGYVMSVQTLDALQERAMRSFSGEFAEYVRSILGEMAPQNRRAFIAVVKLLADLLDGCGNDGDRGAITVAFAELLIVEGEPHDYINLLDRMVEEQERLFEDIGPGAVVGFGTGYGSISGGRSNPSATGSLTSNTSSLRKRFTETLLRQNSRDDRPSVWRTLSKNSNRTLNQAEISNPSSLSKGSINRARSIESPNRRPASRDRPTVLGAFDDRPLSSHGLGSRLSTIGGSPPADKREGDRPKKKRRSSLSDLKSMMAKATIGEASPFSRSPGSLSLQPLEVAPQPATSPKTSTPSKIPAPGSIMNRGRGASMLTGSPMLKEKDKQKENVHRNSATLPRSVAGLTERPINITSTPDVVAIKDLWATNVTPSEITPKTPKGIALSSNIPTLHGHPTPSLRATTNTVRTAPQKLRLQSPQKLRERLQNEAKAISEAETSLQNELSKIGEEMAKLTASSHHTASPRSTEIAQLTKTMKALETRIPEVVKEMTTRNDAVKIDLEKSLQASEFKVKGLDQLYRESSAENEILYEKFNLELERIVKAVRSKSDSRGKADKEDLVVKLKEASEEVARVKKDNAKLKRELLSVRSVLKAHESGASSTS